MGGSPDPTQTLLASMLRILYAASCYFNLYHLKSLNGTNTAFSLVTMSLTFAYKLGDDQGIQDVVSPITNATISHQPLSDNMQSMPWDVLSNVIYNNVLVSHSHIPLSLSCGKNISCHSAVKNINPCKNFNVKVTTLQN